MARGRKKELTRAALYARVSTGDQDVEVQLAELREWAERADVEVVEFIDVKSGRRRDRPGLDALLEAARRREFDAVVVVRLDRVARSLSHMAQVGEELSDLGIELVSLTEGIDTSTAPGRALFGMCGVFAQLELDLIRERTRAGMDAARRRGKRIGRPPALDSRGQARARRLYMNGKTTREIARILDVGQSTVVRALGPIG